MTPRKFTLAVAVNDLAVLRNNLLLSPGLRSGHGHQILIKENFPSAALAYNGAIDEAENDIIIFVHQDIYLPENWFSDLDRSLAYLAAAGVPWGVLGCFGSTRHATGGLGRVYTTGLGLHGRRISRPEPVETLDEIVLIIRKSSGLRFDPGLPHFHLYGTDLCMTARERGMTNFAIPAFCLHNTNQLLALPREFHDCYRHIKAKWAKYLPIYTACMTISRFDEDRHLRMFRDFANKALGRRRPALRRVADAREILAKEAIHEELAR